MSVNKVILKGHLGMDPENNKGTVKFSIATDDGYKNKEGEKIENTNWHNIVAFGKLGEILEKYLKKGNEVVIIGRLQYNIYEDKRYTQIIADSFDFVSSGSVNNSTQENANKSNDAFDGDENDDLPF